MKILIDMNLSPLWVNWFEKRNIKAIHWQDIGEVDAPDTVLFEYACQNGLIVFTHDLDFGTLLAHSGARSPSLLQLRAQDVSPEGFGPKLDAVLRQEDAVSLLEQGALVTVDEKRHRIRILPLKRN
jgi:predicted nuclease of predicted toxin-antitoxin system